MAQAPATLRDLVNHEIDRLGYRNLSELARHTTAVAYQTLWTWQQGQRKSSDPATLLQLAQDWNESPEVIFHAAGLTPPNITHPDAEEASILYMYRQLKPANKRAVLVLMRELINDR